MCFVALYASIPEHLDHFRYLYFGLRGKSGLVLWMRLSFLFMVAALVMLLVRPVRHNDRLLALACALVFAGTWIDKGMGLVAGGFIPSQLHHITEYVPTLPELLISLGVYGIGLFLLTLLLKVAVGVKQEVRG